MTNEIQTTPLKESEAAIEDYLKQKFPRTFNTLGSKESSENLRNYLKARKIAGIYTVKNKIQEVLLNSPLSATDERDFTVIDDDKRKVKVSCFGKNSYDFYVRAFYEDKLPKEFLNTPNFSMLRRIREKASALELDEGGESGVYLCSPSYVHNKNYGRAKMILHLATLLGDTKTPITSDKAVKMVQERLQGKRVLSLGDDTGSLSEILTSFGSIPLGIEYDSEKIAIARTGFFSEDGKPNRSVIQGDIWDLLLPDSKLSRTVGKNWYDAIVSSALFNVGSGGETPHGNSGKLLEEKFGNESDSSYLLETWMKRFILGCERFLKDGGVQMHTNIDIYPRISGSQAFDGYSLFKYKTTAGEVK